MTSRERIRAVLAGEQPDRVPYCELSVDYRFACRLLDRELGDERYYEASEAETMPMEMQREVNERLHRDNVTSALRPPLPATKAEGEDRMGFFMDGDLQTRADLEKLQFPDLESEEVRGPIREFMAERGDYATAMGSRVGISATYLGMGMERFYLMLADDPEFVSEVLSRYVDYSVASVRLAAEMGFDLFWTSDDIAGKGGMLWSPAMFREIFTPHIKRFAEAVRESGIAWIYHSDGDLSVVLPDLVEMGITGFNPIEPQCMDIAEVREAFPELVLVGNVDVDYLSRGPAERVRETVRDLIARLGPHGRYMVSSGNSVVTYNVPENVVAMGDAVVEFGEYPIAL
jgi:uroporphyrinogen decarboxylase